MRRAGVDGVIATSPGLVAFLTGHVMPANLAYPSRDARVGQPTTAIVTLEAALTVGRAPMPTIGESRVYSRPDLGESDSEVAFDALRDALVEAGLQHQTIAIELGQLPAAAAARLAGACPDATVQPLGGLLVEAKGMKSDSEVAGIVEACALTDAGHGAIRRAVRPGVTELELYSEVVRAMNGATDSLVLSGCELMVGRRTIAPGGPPVPTTLCVEPGDLVVSDIYPRHSNGWWGDSCSTVACGEPADEFRPAWRRLMDGLEAGRERLRPGVAAQDVYEAICAYAGEQVPYVGHSIGRDHFEEPVIRAGERSLLQSGAVMVLEPGYSGATQGIRLEWAYRVTEEGGVPLTTFSLDL
jgi:Xaa-Pro aminopeptidase